LKTAVLIVRQRTPLSVRAIQLFEVPDFHIVELKYGELVFARELYMINPLQVHVMNALLLRPGKRVVRNFNDVFSHCERHYPSVRFELYQDEKQKQFRDGRRRYRES
jgi:hypothetical protein